jgi:hypothetical protein
MAAQAVSTVRAAAFRSRIGVVKAAPESRQTLLAVEQMFSATLNRRRGASKWPRHERLFFTNFKNERRADRQLARNGIDEGREFS